MPVGPGLADAPISRLAVELGAISDVIAVPRKAD